MKDGTFTADRLLALYDRVAEAEDAIPRLRRFVLDLAVRGKLVEQDPSDDPAAELLKRIAKEKARLVKAGGLRASKAAEPAMVEAPFDLPFNWAWAAIGTVFIYDAGDKRDPKELDQSLWLLELEDVEKDTGRLIERITADQRESQSTKSQFRAGDILYGKLRPYLNKVLVADEPGYSTTEIVALRPYLPLCSGYCALALRRPDFVEYVTRLGQGTKMPRLRTEDAVVAPFPLPPLAEQQRIVAKVDELKALCDRLQAARAGREAVRDRLSVATLTRLTARETEAETFPSYVRVALQSLPTLTTRTDQIKTLRQTILNLAVRGKLVEQDPAEGRGDDVIAAIETYKSVRRSTRADSALIDFDPPDGWALHSLDAITLDGPKNGLSPTRTEDQTAPKAITLTATTSGQFDGRHFKHVSVTYEEAEPFWLEPDDLLFQRGNTPDYVGMTAIYDGRAKEYLYPDLIMRVRIVKEMNLRFVHLWCISPVGRAYLMANATGAQKTMPKINQGVLKALPIMIPPLAEQHRIVARVDALMALCDQLESSLTTAATTRSRLLDALLHEALDGAAA